MKMKMFKELVFGIDFDGTCVMHCFPEVGNDTPYAIEVLRWIISNNGKLVLNTMRSDCQAREYLTEAVEWFKKNNLPLYGINTNPEQINWTISPKVYAHIYIDDAALGCPLCFEPEVCERPFVDWLAVRDILNSKYLFVEKIHGQEISSE